MKTAKIVKETVNRVKKKKVVYIAGKVTGLPYHDVRKKFMAAADQLNELGYLVLNPILLVDRDTPWQEAMKICIFFLSQANHIYLLHDWQDSKGATLEKQLADTLGIPQLILT